MSAKLVQLIETDLARRGCGTDASDPVRAVTQWWTTGGELVVERDNWADQKAAEAEGKLADALSEVRTLKANAVEVEAQLAKAVHEAEDLRRRLHAVHNLAAELEKNQGVRLPRNGDRYRLARLSQHSSVYMPDDFKVGETYGCIGLSSCCPASPQTPEETADVHFWAKNNQLAAVLVSESHGGYAVPLGWLELVEEGGDK